MNPLIKHELRNEMHLRYKLYAELRTYKFWQWNKRRNIIFRINVSNRYSELLWELSIKSTFYK